MTYFLSNDLKLANVLGLKDQVALMTYYNVWMVLFVMLKAKVGTVVLLEEGVENVLKITRICVQIQMHVLTEQITAVWHP